VVELQREAARSGRMFARVISRLRDTSESGATSALVDLIRASGPGRAADQTDLNDVPTAHANLPFDKAIRCPRTDPACARRTSRSSTRRICCRDSAIGKNHYGNTALVQGLRIIPLLSTLVAVILFLAGVIIMRIRGNAGRVSGCGRTWRENRRISSVTPLSSLAGWIELLEERANEPAAGGDQDTCAADLDRLDRVAHRFERIGR
jgi:hypothetical protein